MENWFVTNLPVVGDVAGLVVACVKIDIAKKRVLAAEALQVDKVVNVTIIIIEGREDNFVDI